MKEKVAKPVQIDRRIQKTKKLLSEALMALIMEKGYAAVTIQDIINRANVGRSTFYAHYESKEQLFLGNINFVSLLFNDQDKDKCIMGINLHFLFYHAYENKILAKALLGKSGGDLITNYFRDIIAHKIMESQKVSNTELLAKYKADAIAAAIITLLTSWLDGDVVLPTDLVLNQAEQLLTCNYGEI
jgi:hypothetical protein